MKKNNDAIMSTERRRERKSSQPLNQTFTYRYDDYFLNAISSTQYCVSDFDRYTSEQFKSMAAIRDPTQPLGGCLAGPIIPEKRTHPGDGYSIMIMGFRFFSAYNSAE